MLIFRRLEKDDLAELMLFCTRCETEELKNNSSLDALKISEIQPPYGQYWIVLEPEKKQIVGISGCHQLREVSPQAYRILYRSCMLPSYRVFESKNLFKSVATNEPIFKNLAPLQVQWAKEQGGQDFFISTNVEIDEPWKEKMVQTNRVLALLARQKIVSLYKENVEIYHCQQNLWRLNESYFMQVLKNKE